VPEQVPDDREGRDQQHAHDGAAADCGSPSTFVALSGLTCYFIDLRAVARRSSGDSAIIASCSSVGIISTLSTGLSAHCHH
jgi:hypothetical protein